MYCNFETYFLCEFCLFALLPPQYKELHNCAHKNASLNNMFILQITFLPGILKLLLELGKLHCLTVSGWLHLLWHTFEAVTAKLCQSFKDSYRLKKNWGPLL